MSSRAGRWWVLAWTLSAARTLAEYDTSTATPLAGYRPAVGSALPLMGHDPAVTPRISRITYTVLHGATGAMLYDWSQHPRGRAAVTTPWPAQAAPTSGNAQPDRRRPGPGSGAYHYDGIPQPSNVTTGMDFTVASPATELTSLLPRAPPTNKMAQPIHPLNVSDWGMRLEGGPWMASSKVTTRSPTTRSPHAPPTGSEPRPHYHPQGARWGPYFEDGPQPVKVTARVGSTVTLDCRIAMLQGKMVTWLHRGAGQLRLLTVGRQSYSADGRLALLFRYPDNWRLQIARVAAADQGEYECQVSTHPPLAKTTTLAVTAPELVIVDDLGRAVDEDRYYKAGSQVELNCVARNLQPGDAVGWWRRARPVHDSANASVGVGWSNATATLTISEAQKAHSGNYTCAAGNASSMSVAVHILNGELPAAVHHGDQGGGGEPRVFAAPQLAALLAAAAAAAR